MSDNKCKTMTVVSILWRKVLLLFTCVASLFIFNEFLMYYVVLLQCSWPQLDVHKADSNIIDSGSEPLKLMFIADTHLLGSREGHWFDKLRRYIDFILIIIFIHTKLIIYRFKIIRTYVCTRLVSKLGPLLFILFVNDIINNFHYAKVRMYANNLKICAVVNNFQDKENLQSELTKLVKWQINGNLK